ncbi:DUF885 family protein [Streptomyces sp. NPDC059650]|uniref:DUF885 family protein n=1 Tax=Streptomyces sp. NPDC059650 TaxID=3346896 RepID=UPI00369795F3
MSLPDTGWPRAQSDAWLSTGLNRTLMPNMALHEVAPGHAGHGRALRRAATDVRRTLHSDAFIEGWTHYGEELALEQGFRGGDPRVAVAVAGRAAQGHPLRLRHRLPRGAMTLPDAAARFTRDVSLSGPAARHEAERGLFDPTHGRSTWGESAILDLRAGRGPLGRRLLAASLPHRPVRPRRPAPGPAAHGTGTRMNSLAACGRPSRSKTVPIGAGCSASTARPSSSTCSTPRPSCSSWPSSRSSCPTGGIHLGLAAPVVI